MQLIGLGEAQNVPINGKIHLSNEEETAWILSVQPVCENSANYALLRRYLMINIAWLLP